jgi:hypothetical protein
LSIDCFRRGQGHALARRVGRRGEQQGQQARHRVGLAGAGAAGDDGDRTAQGDGAGQLLPVRPVGFAARARRHEEHVEPGAYLAGVDRMALARARAHGARDQGLVAPVTAQIQARILAGAVQHQRLAVIQVADLPHRLAGGQGRDPALHALRHRLGRLGQRLPVLLGPAQQGRRGLGQVGQQQAAVAAAFELRQYQRRQQHGRGVRPQRRHEAGKGRGQAAQLTGFGQAFGFLPEGLVRLQVHHTFAPSPSRPSSPSSKSMSRSSR